jgi:hypothetical protein
MIHGQPLSATLPEDWDLVERFWYWHGASGRRYIHSIYSSESCPPVPGAVFVIVSCRGGSRRALCVGRFSTEVATNNPTLRAGPWRDEEIHIHLLAREDEGAQSVLNDLLTAMNSPSPATAEPLMHARPVQLDLLAA